MYSGLPLTFENHVSISFNFTPQYFCVDYRIKSKWNILKFVVVMWQTQKFKGYHDFHKYVVKYLPW